jgi:hypothetical protein
MRGKFTVALEFPIIGADIYDFMVADSLTLTVQGQ